MKIKINFLNDHFVLINLFNNCAVQKWFNKFSSQENHYISTIEDSHPFSNKIDIDQEWCNIKKTFEELNQFNFYPNIIINSLFDGKQDTLNLLHQFFTYNCLWMQNDLPNNIKNRYDSEFKFPETLTYSEWHTIIDKINVAVHNLERTIFRKDKVIQVKSLQLMPDVIKKLEWLEFSKEDYKHNYEYFLKKEKHKNLVLLDRTILGKCVMQSFVDNDDPTADDCTGRFGSFGGFVVELDDTRKQLYQSIKFQEWLRRYQITSNVPYDFPIGYINETNIIDLTHLRDRFGNFKNLEFINN